jgi:multicomponent Na+:H+ antiporter subunit D
VSLSVHLPALQVVVPLVCAPIIVLLRSGRLAWGIATAVSWAALAAAVALAFRVRAEGVVSYAIGNWPPPWGIEYRIDALSAFVLVLVTAVGALATAYARTSVAAELPRDQEYLFYAMYCLCLAGLLGITITGDVFNLFVFLEISSLSTYVMIALGRRRNALVAAFRYLVMGTIGATFYVIGIGLLYLMTGTLNLADLAQRLPGVTDLRPVLAALAFVTVGVGLKLALFPLHQWLPNAYAYAPSVVTAFLAATATKVSVYVLVRFYFGVFADTLAFRSLVVGDVLMLLSLAAIVVASLVALFQPDLKRMFAYSSVAQIGFVTLGVAMANESGLTGAIAHLLNHGVTKLAIFMLVGGIALRCGSTAFAHLDGLGARMPLTSFGIVLAGLSLVGAPATAGFTTKWYLVVGALEQGRWWLAVMVVLSSLISLAYVWRFVEAAYLRPPAPGSGAKADTPLSMLVPAWIAVAACVYLGVETSLNIGGAGRAVEVLLEGLR